MDVTTENFENLVPKVLESLEDADFFAIDLEFTGLNNVSYAKVNSFDTIEEYYQKVRRNCKDFIPIQIGLSAFNYEKSQKKFKETTYNFYIFRRPNKYTPNQSFLCQSSSIDFLISHDFNFNKLFKHGISYLNNEEEEQYQKCLSDEEKAAETTNSSAKDKVEIPASDQPFINEIVDQIKEFLKSDESEPLQLPKCNPFLRKLIYQTTEEIFGSEILVKTKILENKDRVLIVTKINGDEMLEELAKKHQEEQVKAFDTALGFSKVMKAIVRTEKLIVGHNMLFDLLHIIDKFLTPVSENYLEFKDCAHSLLPRVLDTKFMSNSDTFKDIIKSTVLGDIIKTIQKPPFVIPLIESKDGSSYSLSDDKQHEAGFDSYITGIAFIALWKYLGDQKRLSDEEIFVNSNLFEPFVNKLYIMKLIDNPHMHLGGRDPKLVRTHVFHLTFPKQWKNIDIQQLFSPFGNVYIAWIDEVSAFVSLHKRDQAAIAYAALKSNRTCTVLPYEKWFQDRSPSKRTDDAKQSKIRRKIQGSSVSTPKKLKVSDK